MEIWKPVKNFPNYQVSNYGRLKSLSRVYLRKNPKHNDYIQTVKIKEKIISGWVKYYGNRPMCVKVSLRKNNKTHEMLLHRIILETFIGECPNGYEGCHNDGNPLNNHIDNLRWDNHANNMKDCQIHGTKKNPPIHYGEKHPLSKLKWKDVIAIRNTVFQRGTPVKLAKLYGVSSVTIKRIKDGEVWKDNPKG